MNSALQELIRSNRERPRRSCDDLMTDAELKCCELERLLCNGNGGGRSLCDCPECEIKGVRYPLHRVPLDCEYVRNRNALIAQAEKIASKHLRKGNGNGESSDSNFTALFARQMDLLASQLGL